MPDPSSAVRSYPSISIPWAATFVRLPGVRTVTGSASLASKLNARSASTVVSGVPTMAAFWNTRPEPMLGGSAGSVLTTAITEYVPGGTRAHEVCPNGSAVHSVPGSREGSSCRVHVAPCSRSKTVMWPLAGRPSRPITSKWRGTVAPTAATCGASLPSISVGTLSGSVVCTLVPASVRSVTRPGTAPSAPGMAVSTLLPSSSVVTATRSPPPTSTMRVGSAAIWNGGSGAAPSCATAVCAGPSGDAPSRPSKAVSEAATAAVARGRRWDVDKRTPRERRKVESLDSRVKVGATGEPLAATRHGGGTPARQR